MDEGTSWPVPTVASGGPAGCNPAARAGAAAGAEEPEGTDVHLYVPPRLPQLPGGFPGARATSALRVLTFASEALDPNRASPHWAAISGELPVCSGPLPGNAASPRSKKF